MATENFVFRTSLDRQTIISYLYTRKLPFVVCVKDIEPIRSDQARKYYGTILNYLSDYTGYSNKELHEYYKWQYGVESTKKLSRQQFWQYCERICSEWSNDGIPIPLPNEVIYDDQLRLL